jgi:lipoyl(octanoyl) transferase
MAGIEIIDCRIKDYNTVLLMQEQAAAALQAGGDEEKIFIVEHKPVITLGVRTEKNKLLKDSEIIKKSGIEIVSIRRGGGSTAHNPGQLVVYPIINLKKHNLGVSDYVHLLEKIGIEFLEALGVKSQTKKGFPGLWVEDMKPRINTNKHDNKNELSNSVNLCQSVSNNNSVNPCLKIASIGVQIKKWVTFHGIAINVNNDLSIFDFLVPCGLDDVIMTSVEKQLGRKIDIEQAKKKLKKILLKYF